MAPDADGYNVVSRAEEIGWETGRAGGLQALCKTINGLSGISYHALFSTEAWHDI